jgi:hypothetical protein
MNKQQEQTTESKKCITYSNRACKAEDLYAAREICIETSSLPLRNEKDRQFLLLMFCNPYVEFSSDCFVAVDEADRAVGYIFCAKNTRLFFKDFRKNIMPLIKQLGLKYSLEARGMCFLHRLCAVKLEGSGIWLIPKDAEIYLERKNRANRNGGIAK